MSGGYTPPTRAALTAVQLWRLLGDWIERRPECADWPVHLLDMEDDGAGLLTDAEWDMFDEDIGMVVSLMAWESRGV